MTDLFDRLPKYIQIKEAIRKEIEGNRLKEGEQLASESVLIERFGASKMTVIRALQELVQEGYLRRVQGKGTYVTRPVLNTPQIGVIVPGTDRGIFSVILHSIEEQAHRMGYQILLCSTDGDTAKVNTFMHRIIQSQAAGIIAAPLERVAERDFNLRWYKAFQEAEIPVVLVDRGIEGVKNPLLVQTNNEEAMAELTREVIQRGHRRILLARWEEIQSSTTQSRTAGFLKAAKEEPKVELAQVITVKESKPFKTSVDEFQTLLYELEPTVIMTINDHIALHVFSLLKNVDSDLGKDISVTGFDDLAFSSVMNLTTVHQPLEELGRAAVDMIHGCIHAQEISSRMIPSHVVIRSSLKTRSVNEPGEVALTEHQ